VVKELMANARTNSLHERLPVEIREQVMNDLVDQPPGRETYEKVYEHYQLDVHGISFSSLCRWGGYLRTLKRNEWIRGLGDELVGEENLGAKNEGLIRQRLFEVLTTGETKLGDLLKAAMTEKSLREAVIKTEEWETKKAAMAKALVKAEAEAQDDPAKALANLTEKVKLLYAIPLEAKKES
jgi:hypothetical protein